MPVYLTEEIIHSSVTALFVYDYNMDDLENEKKNLLEEKDNVCKQLNETVVAEQTATMTEIETRRKYQEKLVECGNMTQDVRNMESALKEKPSAELVHRLQNENRSLKKRLSEDKAKGVKGVSIVGESSGADRERKQANRFYLHKLKSFETGNNLELFIKQFENYKKAAGMAEEDSTSIFISYLDAKSIQKIGNKPFLDLSWDDFKKFIVKELTPLEESILAKSEVTGTKQKRGETVREFGDRLVSLAEKAYPEKKNWRSEQLLKDCFLRGVSNDEICERLHEMELPTLDENIEKASKMEAAKKARQIEKGDTDIVGILRVEEKPTSSGPQEKLICFNCQGEHYAIDCKEPRKCHRCKSESHFIKDCPQPAKEGEEVNTFRPRYRQNYYSGQEGYNRRVGGYRRPPHYINMRPRENNNDNSQRMRPMGIGEYYII